MIHSKGLQSHRWLVFPVSKSELWSFTGAEVMGELKGKYRGPHHSINTQLKCNGTQPEALCTYILGI